MSAAYRSDIDGLRAVAVGSVVAFHAGLSAIPGGFTGVDIFFVISGFLITGLLVAETEATGRVSIASFYARRVRRLFPALAALGHDVTWNDFRGELIDYVRMKLPPGVAMAFEPGNILDKADDLANRFDLVLALEVVEHVAHPDQFLASVARLVRPGGHIIVSTPNGGYLMNPLPRFSDFDDPSVFEGQQFKPDADGHIFLLHEDEMRSLCAAAGLEVVEHRLFSAPLTCGYLKTGAVARRLPDSVISLAERLAMAMPGPLRRRLATASLTALRRPMQPA